MKRSIGFLAHFAFFTLGNCGRAAGLKLHQSDLDPVLAVAGSGAAGWRSTASPALPARAQAAQASRMIVPVFKFPISTSPSHSPHVASALHAFAQKIEERQLQRTLRAELVAGNAEPLASGA